MDIEKFDPTRAQIEAVVSETRNITANDLEDKAQLKVVKENRIKLRDLRVKIEKTGKALREEANAFSKAVITKEKELIGLVTPEEDRLKGIEEEAKMIIEKKYRASQLPARYAKIEETKIGCNDITDEFLLDMSDEQFTEWLNKAIEEKNERERLALEKERAEIEAEKNRLAREKELEEAKKKAAEEAKLQAEKDAQYAKERSEREVKEANERAERAEREAKEKVEREQREKETKEAEERKKMEKDEMYRLWLETLGVTEENKNEYRIQRYGNKVEVAKIIGYFTFE